MVRCCLYHLICLPRTFWSSEGCDQWKKIPHKISSICLFENQIVALFVVEIDVKALEVICLQKKEFSSLGLFGCLCSHSHRVIYFQLFQLSNHSERSWEKSTSRQFAIVEIYKYSWDLFKCSYTFFLTIWQLCLSDKSFDSDQWRTPDSKCWSKLFSKDPCDICNVCSIEAWSFPEFSQVSKYFLMWYQLQMFSSSPCLQQHHRRMSFLSLSLQYLQWIRFLLSIAAQTCAHTYQSFIPMPEEYFFPKDLTDGRAPRFAKVSLETKYNIVVGTQIVLKPGALDGLQKLKMSWVRTFCCRRTLRKFSCGFMMLFVHHSIPTEVRRNEWRIILFRPMVGLKSMFTIWLLIDPL